MHACILIFFFKYVIFIIFMSIFFSNSISKIGKSTEYLLQEFDVNITSPNASSSTPASASSASSSSSIPRVSRRDLLATTRQADHKRRSRSLEPTQLPWAAVKLTPPKKPVPGRYTYCTGCQGKDISIFRNVRVNRDVPFNLEAP